MIISIDHNNIWTENGKFLHNIKPYFLIEDTGDIPILNDVTELSEPFELDSWVRWNQKIKVRKVFLTHPGVTPRVSYEYYKLGYSTFEQAVPFLNRVAANLEAGGDWILDTKGEWKTLNGLVDDIEYRKDMDWLSCIGLGKFQIKIKSSVDLEKEKYDLEVDLPDECEVSQLLCDKGDKPYEMLRNYVKALENTHILIGHNISEYDNYEMYEIINKYPSLSVFLKERFNITQGFFRGRTVEHLCYFYPMTFDTLYAARYLYKAESEVGYGLKQLALKFNLAPKDRVYERDFGGWGNWDINNPKCLKYNQDDIVETYGLFKKEFKAVLLQMFITGMSFQDTIQDSNGRLGDHLSLIRGYGKIINPPMMNPSKVAQSLNKHFSGQLKTKQQIFDYFRIHECNADCAIDDKPYNFARDKLLRVVKYGQEMPDWVEYYPLLLDYLMAGGLSQHPTKLLIPVHFIKKGDVAAMYPTIVKSLNICPDTVRLSRKGERVDGWCWYRKIGITKILDLFEWKPATDFNWTDGEGYCIGYQQRGQEGLLNKALTGVLKAVQQYKKLPEWKEAYDKALKPMRNAFSFGVLLGLDSTCQQYNIAGAAIPTKGQEITTNMNQYLKDNGYELIYSDTDGSEFTKIDTDSKPFEYYIKKVEEWWTERLNYPFKLDIETLDHKLYKAMKNYISIEGNNVTLKGNSFHALDKPKIAENTMKKLMLQILPKTNTRDEFIGTLRMETHDIVENEFKDIKNQDLIIISRVSPPENYSNDIFKQRAEVIERLLEIKIIFPTKQEFYVCKERLPGVEGEKTYADPISFMWPRSMVEDNKANIDYDWYKDMVYAYIDSAFELQGVSTKTPIRSIATYFDQLGESEEIEHTESKIKSRNNNQDVEFKPTKNQQTLF